MRMKVSDEVTIVLLLVSSYYTPSKIPLEVCVASVASMLLLRCVLGFSFICKVNESSNQGIMRVWVFFQLLTLLQVFAG